jgi:hypothetical protein
MRIEVPYYDHRERLCPDREGLSDETGKLVGRIAYKSGPTMYVSLFAGKYRGEFHSDKECEAFVRGVEAVLNYVLTTE